MMSEGSTIVNLTQRASGKDSKLVDLSDKVHQLPCAIKYNGHCSVSDFFKPRSTGIEVEGLKLEEAYFRGRKLQGATIPLPKGYCGDDCMCGIFVTNQHGLHMFDVARSQATCNQEGVSINMEARILEQENFLKKMVVEIENLQLENEVLKRKSTSSDENAMPSHNKQNVGELHGGDVMNSGEVEKNKMQDELRSLMDKYKEMGRRMGGSSSVV